MMYEDVWLIFAKERTNLNLYNDRDKYNYHNFDENFTPSKTQTL